MAKQTFVPGDVISCIIPDTKKHGTLHVDHDKIWVEFVDFGERSAVNADAPIYLHASNGYVVSLHDNVDLSPSIPAWRRGDVSVIFRQCIISNLAIVGHTPWLESDLVAESRFTLSKHCSCLWPSDILRGLANTSTQHTPDTEMLRVTLPTYRIGINFSLTSDNIRDTWLPDRPYICLSMPENQISVSECLDKIWYISSLFLLLSWDIGIDSAEIFLRKVDAEEDSPFHRIINRSSRHTGRDYESSADVGVLSSNSPAERENMEAVIHAWCSKVDRWRECCGLLRAAVGRLNNVSAERALDACRWHEELERAQDGPAVPEGMTKVIEAAARAAEDADLRDYVDWIRARLSGVRGEPQKLLFSRLAHHVNEKLQQQLFDEAGVQMLRGAYKARHKTGHGVMSRQSPDGVRRLWGDTLAMEALCATRMLSELPLPTDRLHCFSMHPLLKAFKALRNERRSDLRTGS